MAPSIYFFSFLVIILFFTLMILLYKKYNIIENFNNMEEESNNKLCLLYAYYEKNELYKNNFITFLENGIVQEIDYYIIINGTCSVNIPKYSNIKIYYRPNIGYDFGAYSYCIQNHLKKEYQYYFFMNTSVIGPYLKYNSAWYIPFLELFKENVVLVGTSINMFDENIIETYNLTEIYGDKTVYSHVQSMFFCINNPYFHYLKNINFFNEGKINAMKNIKEIIVYKELGLSQHALNNGWNINCMLDKYKDLDYTTFDYNINVDSMNGDPYYEGAYFGDTIDKYDVIFYKNNR